MAHYLMFCLSIQVFQSPWFTFSNMYLFLKEKYYNDNNTFKIILANTLFMRSVTISNNELNAANKLNIIQQKSVVMALY